MTALPSFKAPVKAIVIGASGGIGAAMTARLLADPNVGSVHAVSRSVPKLAGGNLHTWQMDFTDEARIKAAAGKLSEHGPFDIICVATGLLHNADISPEKSTRDLSLKGFEQSFLINTAGPAMTAKHFLPLLRRDAKSVFAALSARVGSISDNRLGGWYAYRASKAALNMVIKTLAVEYGRKRKHMVIMGLHPGTVDTALSEPFQRNVPEGKLFTADDSAEKLLAVMDGANIDDSGKLLAWDGQVIAF